MKIKSIKFYAQIPSSDSTKTGTRIAATFFAVGGDVGDQTITQLDIEFESVGHTALLHVKQTTGNNEVKTFIYNMEDISGRIEVTN